MDDICELIPVAYTNFTKLLMQFCANLKYSILLQLRSGAQLLIRAQKEFIAGISIM